MYRNPTNRETNGVAWWLGVNAAALLAVFALI
jgi:hypothetical protein